MRQLTEASRVLSICCRCHCHLSMSSIFANDVPGMLNKAIPSGRRHRHGHGSVTSPGEAPCHYAALELGVGRIKRCKNHINYECLEGIQHSTKGHKEEENSKKATGKKKKVTQRDN